MIRALWKFVRWTDKWRARLGFPRQIDNLDPMFYQICCMVVVNWAGGELRIAPAEATEIQKKKAIVSRIGANGIELWLRDKKPHEA